MANTLKFGNGEWYGKKDTILAYNDENNNYKPLPFDFSRASSATRVNKDGLIETVGSGEPRIDFKDNAKGALLLEPSRSNVVDNSSNFFIGSWSGTRVNEGSTINAPNGIDEAHKLIATSVSNTHYREYTVSSASAGSYTGSCFFKKGEFNVGTIRMSVDSYANRIGVYINLDNGTHLQTATIGSPTGTSYKIEDYGNGWYRLSVSIIHTSGEVRMSLSNASSDYSNSNGLPVFLGNNSDGGYSWGGQVEQGSYATSYIPTSGSAVTRLADSCYQDNLLTDIINASYPFTMYAEAKAVFDSTQYFLTFGNRGASNQYFTLVLNNDGTIKLDARANGVSENLVSTASAISNGEFFKVAVSMESATSGKISVNGNLDSKTNFTQQSVNTDIKDLLIGQLRTISDTGQRIPISDVKLYNTALTDNELQQLTQV